MVTTMPLKRVGNKIYHKKGGKWKLAQTCKSAANAKAAMRARHMDKK